jgi:hypothetical protein
LPIFHGEFLESVKIFTVKHFSGQNRWNSKIQHEIMVLGVFPNSFPPTRFRKSRIQKVWGNFTKNTKKWGKATQNGLVGQNGWR